MLRSEWSPSLCDTIMADANFQTALALRPSRRGRAQTIV